MHASVEQELIQAATAVQARAYAPYSRFFVGAALRTASGKVFAGCNVENASYGLAICAERSAVTAMIAQGELQIASVVVSSQGGVTPCGACRQVLAEFGGDYEVLLYDSTLQQVAARWKMSDLLPGAFRLSS
jgi:cytidine deaminase